MHTYIHRGEGEQEKEDAWVFNLPITNLFGNVILIVELIGNCQGLISMDLC